MTWPASADEIGGALNVRSYSVYRRIGAGAWGTPVYTVAGAGTANYLWEDYVVPLGQLYQYGVVARNCTPSLSAMMTAAGTVAPNP